MPGDMMHGKYPGWHMKMYPGLTVYTKIARPDLPRITVSFDDVFKVFRTTGSQADYVPFDTWGAAEAYWTLAYGAIPKKKHWLDEELEKYIAGEDIL